MSSGVRRSESAAWESTMKTHLRLLVVIASVPILAGCAAATTTPQPTPTPAGGPIPIVIAEGHLVPARSEALTFAARGRLAEVLVEKGDTVAKGQVLLRLGDRGQADAALAASLLELTAAQQAFDSLDRTSALAHAQAWQACLQAQKVRAEAERTWERIDLDAVDRDITDAEARVEDRRSDLKDAQEEFDKYKELDEDNTSRTNAEDRLTQAREDLNEALRRLDEVRARRDVPRAALDAALAQEAEARRAFQNTQDGPDKDQLALAKARLANAEAQHAAAQAAVDSYDLEAPFTGTVMDLQAEPGQTVGPQAWVVLLADTSAWTIDTSDLNELEVVNLAIGDPVVLKADALPGETFTGRVTEIINAPKTQAGDVLYTVRITPDTIDARWRWGMTFEVDVMPAGG
jgi:multidrug resistance efflux pump